MVEIRVRAHSVCSKKHCVRSCIFPFRTKYSWNISLIREIPQANYLDALEEGHKYDFDLLVIGVSPGNIICAIEAKQLGANVAVVHYSTSPSSTGIAFVLPSLSSHILSNIQ